MPQIFNSNEELELFYPLVDGQSQHYGAIVPAENIGKQQLDPSVLILIMKVSTEPRWAGRP